jgi:hypothetical protein
MNTGAAIVTYSAIQGGYTGENNINLEVENFGTDTDKFYPFFANPTTFAGPAINTSDSLAVVNADWQIMNGSACVDVGNPDTTGLYISNIDIAGNSRIMNCRIDIGAYEMQDGGRLQTLDLGNLLTDLRYGGESIGLPGETNEGIAIIYSSSDEGIAAINDNTLEIISGGIFRLTVTAPAINGYCEYARVIEVQIQNVPISTPGPVIYVKPRDSGSGDGSSWENATSNIQAALNASELVIGEKPKIWVAQGEYILAAELIMKEGVNVYGGFIGTETSLTDRPELTYGETASGQASILNANASESSMRCVLNQSIAFTTETTWDGFVLKNGYADNGGGAYLRASGKLNNCIISNNTASNGGGVYCNQGGILTNCNITNNSAITYSGGGIYCNQGGTMTNCIISNNTSSYSGGGVYCYSGSILNNCEISNNTSQYGGGVYCYFIDILTNCNIINNTASSYGGGVFCSFGGTLTNCNITNNSTTGSNGGGVYCSSGGTLTNCIIWSNKKGEDFEQIYVYSGPTVVTYCAVQDGYTGDSNISLNAENSGTDENNFYPFFANPTTFVGVATNSAGRLAIANADWRITGESACVNIGIADTTGLNIPDTDIAGNPRIVNDRIDIGVYEYDGITLSQTITWEQTFYGFYITSEPVELTATASSSLTVNYISSNENVAIIINGNELQIIGAGSANITAVQPGNENYFPAQSITKTINVLNNDATLSNLTVSEGVLDPEFDPQTFTYTVNVEPEVETIEISATPGDSNATISEDSDTGTQSLDYGENIFSIMVTAEDGETSEIYTVKVVRENYSIVENINAAKIEVYPNPAKEQLKISIADNSKIITVEISDVQGQLLNTIKLNNDETIVNISSLPAGIYFVKIVTDKTTEIKKIIIQ